MKKVILILTALIGSVILNSGFTSVHNNTSTAKFSKFANVNVTASNSTSDGVYVVLTNTTSGGSYSFFVPPNTASGTVIGQIPENNDIYSAQLTSTGRAHDMWIYWEHRTQVSSFTVTGMALGCNSCARIDIFN
ncbi:hypothetical protein ACJVDH_03385 [Pedobacter sp. AW1-32]|uniref:hypothetical protein n=1 Tax=Pedobacter sp. AW1-32 TaxID=3383026 RepID=UPI003FEF3631